MERLGWRDLFLIASLLSASVCLPGKCEDNTSTDAPYECHPSEADMCFADVNENLLCHVHSPVGRNCTFRNARDLCDGMDDALNCTSEIIDTDCLEDDSRRRIFDNWYLGFRGAYNQLCQQQDYVLLDKLLKDDKCWNFRKFIKCIEKTSNLTQMSDLVTTELDQVECNLLQMVVGVCIKKAEKARVICRGKADALNEAVAAFFTSSACSGVTPLPSSCGSGGPQKLTANAQSSTGAAVISTLVVTILLVTLIAFFLIRQKIVTINTTLNLMRNRPTEAVEEPGEDYARFL